MILDYRVVVDFSDVIKEGMIKRKIFVNPSLSTEKLEGKDINPLLLIQLPDKSSMDYSDRQTVIILSKLHMRLLSW